MTNDHQLDLFNDIPGAGASPAHVESAAVVDGVDAVPADDMPTPTTPADNVVVFPLPRRRRRAPASGKPARETVPFPLARRRSKVVDVATKMVATKSRRHAEFYRAQVTEALQVHLRSRGVPAELWLGEIARFWQAVGLEVLRRRGRASGSPRGGAA